MLPSLLAGPREAVEEAGSEQLQDPQVRLQCLHEAQIQHEALGHRVSVETLAVGSKGRARRPQATLWPLSSPSQQ